MKIALIIIAAVIVGFAVKFLIEDWLYERSLSDKEKFMRDGWMDARTIRSRILPWPFCFVIQLFKLLYNLIANFLTSNL